MAWTWRAFKDALGRMIDHRVIKEKVVDPLLQYLRRLKEDRQNRVPQAEGERRRNFREFLFSIAIVCGLFTAAFSLESSPLAASAASASDVVNSLGNLALNPIVADEVKTPSQAVEDTGLEPDGSEKQQTQQQPVAATRPTPASQASSYQLSPRSDIDQPGSSSPLGRLKLRSLTIEFGSVMSPDAGVGTHKKGRNSSTNVFYSRASQDGENKGDSDDAKVPSDLLPPTGIVDSTNVFQDRGDYRSQIQWIDPEINVRQIQGSLSEETMQKLIPSTAIVIHEGGGRTSSNVLISGAQDGENKGDSDNAKPPFVPLAQGTGSGPGSISGNATAGDESNRPVSIVAGEVLSATDTDTTESDEIQGDKEKSDASQDGNTQGNSSPRQKFQ